MKRRARKEPLEAKLQKLEELSGIISSSTYCLAPRRRQYEEIREILVSTFKEQVTFISGNPGCGKSATVKELLSEVTKPYAFLNAAQLINYRQFYKQLCAQFKDIKLSKCRTEKAARALCEKRTIIIDEVDYLKPRMLYDLFELNAKIIIIANSLSFLQEDVRIQSRGQNVRQILFQDYTKDELVQIIKEKLQKSEFLGEFPEQVLNLAAQRVVQRGGDLREYQDCLVRIYAVDDQISMDSVQKILGKTSAQKELFTAEELQILQACTDECELRTLEGLVGSDIAARIAIGQLATQGVLEECEEHFKYRSLLDRRLIAELQ